VPASPAAPLANELSEPERQHILMVLRSEQYCDLAPAQVWARLLDDGIYLCSIRTMYRLLSIAGENRERGRQRTHPARKKSELIARAPNQVARDQLNLHAERGSSMTSKPVAQLLVDLCVTRSHSRPSVSNDNPYSEAQFKTLKYCSAFPGRFGSIVDARTFCTAFFDHYNHIHRHTGLALHTRASVHDGTATEIQAKRAETLAGAYDANPARFRHRTPPELPEVAWINEPNREALIKSA
jgi:putative transposase